MANCFYPYIKCHLPHNFHLRYTFNYFAQKMGVKKSGKIPNTHATIFKKTDNNTYYLPTRFENMISRSIFHILEAIKPPLKTIYNRLRRQQ